MAEWDESSRDMADFGEHERTSADYFAATEDSEMEYQQRTFQHKDPNTQHYPDDEQGSDPFVVDHNTHSSQEHEDYRQAQIVPDLDHGHSYDHFESQHQQQQHYLEEDPSDLPANFAREPAKNEQFQMGTEDDDLEYQREQTGTADERMDQYEYHQQVEESRAGGSNPFDVADGLLAQRTVAVEEPEHSNPNPFAEQDQPYETQPTDFDNEEIPREMEHAHDSHPDVMAAMTRGDERFEGQGDEEEDEDSDTENTADHFQYGKMEEEDATEEIPADEPDARDVPVVGIDNHAFDYQEEPARDEPARDEHQEDEKRHYEEMEQEPDRGMLPPSEPAVGFESSMTAAPIAGEADTTEEQSDEPRYDPNVDNVAESQHALDTQQPQIHIIEADESMRPEICDPMCFSEKDREEEQLISGGFEREQTPEMEPSMQAHEPQSEVYDDDRYEHDQSEVAVRDSTDISAQEFQSSNIETTQAEPNRYDQVEEEDEFEKRPERDEFEEKEEKYEGQQETEYPEKEVTDEDAIESVAIGAQFTQPGFVGEIQQEEFEHKEQQHSYEYQEENRYTEEKRFDNEIEAEDEHKEEQHSYEYQEEKQSTEEKKFDDEIEAAAVGAQFTQPGFEEKMDDREQQQTYEDQQENDYPEEKIADDVIEPVAVGPQFTQPGSEEKMDDELIEDREQHQTYEDQQENDYPEEKITDDEIEPVAVGAQFTQPGSLGETTSYPVDDTIDNRQDDMNAFEVEKQDEEILKESNAYEEQTDFQTSNFGKEEQEIPSYEHGFTQLGEKVEEPDHTTAAEKSNEAVDTLYTDSEGPGVYQGETDHVKEEMDQSASDDQSHAPPPSSIGELDPVTSSHEEKKSFVDNLDELASPETIPQPLPSPPEPRTISNFDPLVPDSSSSSPPRSPSLENHEGYGQTEAQVDGLYQNEVMNDVQAEAADFLTAGEVEGETKFGVDGSAVTKSASQNNQFLTSEEEEDESPQMEYDYAKQEEILTTATTETTTTETETSERSGDLDSNSVDPGTFEQYEAGGHDNALMSMSMEGSFYDDGGDLIGGDDNHADKDAGNIMYQSAITEESEPSCSFSPRQESLLRNEQQFAEQQAQREMPRESFPEENDYEAKEDGLRVGGVHDQQQIPISQESSDAPIPSGFDDIEPKTNAFDQEQPVNGTVNAQDPFDSLLDAPVTETGLQTPVTDSSSTAFESSVDVHDTLNMAPVTNRDIESSSVDVTEINTAAEPINGFAQAVDEEITRDSTEKVESAGASTVSVVEPVPDQKEVAETASSQPPEPVAVPDAAAAAAVVPEVKSVTKTAEEKKKPKKAATTTSTGTAKKTTTTTLSKKSTTTSTKSGDAATVSKSTSSTTSASARTSRVSSARTTTTSTTKKTETSSTTPRQTSPTKKPTEAKTTTPAEKKTPRPASSPTKAPAKSSPLPSYAQPITPRKPREAKAPTEPATKRPATAGGTSSTRPTSSTTPRTRPASATTRTSTTTTSRTTTSTTSSTAARPKFSPTKLANGSHTDRSTSPTKKTGVGAKPAGEKKEIKTPSSGSRGTASPATGARSPQKATSPRTPTSAGSAKSKIGSLNNANHTPGGGAVKITTKKVDYSSVTSRVGSKDKMDHKPGGGNVRIENRKVKVEAKSKVGSLDNATHKPAGGDKKIETKKLDWKVESKIGSLDNARHVAGGGDKKIENRKVEWSVTSKVGSLENAKHVPKGGDKKIETHKTDWNVQPRIGSLDNVKHKPGGGDKQIVSEKLDWKVDARIGSLENAKHVPGGGNIQIENHHLDFKDTASPKIGSLDRSRTSSTGSNSTAPIESSESKANGGSPV